MNFSKVISKSCARCACPCLRISLRISASISLRRLLVGLGRFLLLLRAWAACGASSARGCTARAREAVAGCVVRCGCALFVGALLGFACFLLAFFAALLGFYDVVAQFAFVAEQTAVGNSKFRFFFFFWHKNTALGSWRLALCCQS